MIFTPKKYIQPVPNINLDLLKLEGELDEELAKATLAQFLRYNLNITTDWVMGVKLPAYQLAVLKAFFLRNYNLCVMGRGCGKTHLAALACYLLPIFNPGTNIVIAGPSFRTARNIFSYMEKMENSKEGILLKQCVGVKSKRNDLWELELNGGKIRAIPLNERVRGFRANVLIIDEFLLLSEDIVKDVLMPFLVIPADVKERIVITRREDEKISRGEMTEDQRTIFGDTSRLICLSSASYSFEYLYTLYKDWCEKIFSDKMDVATYFVNQVAFDAIPSYMIEKSVIEEAKSSDDTHPSFKREYCAIFTDGSDSYFSAKKMHQLTIQDGERPTTLIRGNPNKIYSINIDPNFSQSASADHFAMNVLELDIEEEKATLVHNYAVAGVELRKHIEYFYYLITNFNVVIICADSADGNFVQSANESSLFINNNIKIDMVNYDGSLKGEDYTKMLKEVRNEYNLGTRKICFKHLFNQDSIRRINEQLQTWINTNRIHFASRLTQLAEDYEAALNIKLPLQFEKNESLLDLISNNDDLIYTTKKECSLIEVTTSPTGGQKFDLPAQLRRNASANRARRDSYTALLLGIESAEAYFAIMKQQPKESHKMFTPTMFGQSTY